MRKTLAGAVIALTVTGGVVATAAPALANATCVNSYYKLHGSTVAEGRIASDVEAAILAHTGAADITTAFNQNPKDLYGLAVEQYITTALNGTPGDTLDPSSDLGEAFYGLSTYFQYSTDPSFTNAQVIKWTATLAIYNQGWAGTPTCTSIKPPPPPRTSDCHGYKTYFLTGAWKSNNNFKSWQGQHQSAW